MVREYASTLSRRCVGAQTGRIVKQRHLNLAAVTGQTANMTYLPARIMKLSDNRGHAGEHRH